MGIAARVTDERMLEVKGWIATFGDRVCKCEENALSRDAERDRVTVSRVDGNCTEVVTDC